MTTHEIIFHHYPSSPFSEKIRVAFGIKQLAWRSVEQPIIMPKPELIPLTGGYRKIPVMQIGADIYATRRSFFASWSGAIPCRRYSRSRTASPMPSASGATGCSSCRASGSCSARSAIWCRRNSSRTARRCPAARSQPRRWRPLRLSRKTMARARRLCGRDARRRPRLYGRPKPGAADIHAYMNFWWVKAALPHIAGTMMQEFPKIDAWVARIAALGHGKPDADESERSTRHREGRNLGCAARDRCRRSARFEIRRRGDGSADDYGRDPIAGEIVFQQSP